MLIFKSILFKMVQILYLQNFPGSKHKKINAKRTHVRVENVCACRMYQTEHEHGPGLGVRRMWQKGGPVEVLQRPE